VDELMVRTQKELRTVEDRRMRVALLALALAMMISGALGSRRLRAANVPVSSILESAAQGGSFLFDTNSSWFVLQLHGVQFLAPVVVPG
jgi:hypothetical protein